MACPHEITQKALSVLQKPRNQHCSFDGCVCCYSGSHVYEMKVLQSDTTTAPKRSENVWCLKYRHHFSGLGLFEFLTIISSHNVSQLYIIYYYNWLVVLTILKNIRRLGWLFPTEWKNKTCLKPPTSYNHYRTSPLPDPSTPRASLGSSDGKWSTAWNRIPGLGGGQGAAWPVMARARNWSW